MINTDGLQGSIDEEAGKRKAVHFMTPEENTEANIRIDDTRRRLGIPADGSFFGRVEGGPFVHDM